MCLQHTKKRLKNDTDSSVLEMLCLSKNRKFESIKDNPSSQIKDDWMGIYLKKIISTVTNLYSLCYTYVVQILQLSKMKLNLGKE